LPPKVLRDIPAPINDGHDEEEEPQNEFKSSHQRRAEKSAQKIANPTSIHSNV
jgi:hypothetical protein